MKNLTSYMWSWVSQHGLAGAFVTNMQTCHEADLGLRLSLSALIWNGKSFFFNLFSFPLWHSISFLLSLFFADVISVVYTGSHSKLTNQPVRIRSWSGLRDENSSLRVPQLKHSSWHALHDLYVMHTNVVSGCLFLMSSITSK